MPLVVVSLLDATGIVTSFIPLALVGVALSTGASCLGAKVWARIHRGDIVFAELMLWGWLRRVLLERQLASAIRLLGLEEAAVADAAVDDREIEIPAARRVRLLRQLATALEARYPDTHGHSRRVARHATVIAKRMGLPAEEVARIRTAATVHDVGKVDLSPAIINKPARLSDAEYNAIKQHSTIGAEMVFALEDEKLTSMVRHHHERLDGGGYPDGLKGKEIPLGARIIAVADTFDAVTSTRPYRSARRHKQALALLEAEAGAQLDPAAVRAFRSYYTGYRPVALWALALNGPRQLLTAFTGGAKLGGVATATAATIATVAAGNLAVHAFHADHAGAGAAQASDASATLSSAGAGAVPGRLAAFEQRNRLGERRAVLSGSSQGAKAVGGAEAHLSRLGSSPGTTGQPSGGESSHQSLPVPAASEEAGGAANSSAGGGSHDEPQHGVDAVGAGSGNGGGSSSDESRSGSGSGSGSSSAGSGSSNAGSGSSNAGGGNGNSHSGESVALPDSASSTAQSAVEGVVKGGGAQPPVASPPPPPPPSSPPPPPQPPKGPPAGVGNPGGVP